MFCSSFCWRFACWRVVVTLVMGFYALFRGGEFGRRWSNKLMRLRVLLQFGAIVLLAAVMLMSHHGQ